MLPPLAQVPTGVNEDDWKAACAVVRAFCRWHIAPEHTETVTLDGPEGHTLFLRTHRLTEVHSITNDGTEVTDPEWSSAGMVRGTWSRKFRSIVIEMSHGHESCPPEILDVLRALAKRAPQAGLKAKGVGPFSETYADEVLASAERAVLLPYRIENQP